MKKILVLVIVILVAGTFSIFAGGEQEQSKEITSFDWKNFEGDEIRFVALNFYYTNFLKEYASEFEDLTGIKVTFETYPENQYYQKVLIELASGNESLDVFATAGNCNEGFKYSQAGWYEPLDQYVNSDVLTSPDWDPEDFFPAVYNAQVIDGKRIAIPLNAVTWLLYYRSDLFAEKGIEVPKTMEELVAAAEKLNDSDTFGYVGRGSKAQGAMTWSNFLYNYGGQWLDGQTPAFNSPEGVKALETYATLMSKYSNPGSSSNEWTDVQAMMQQGQAAMIIDANAWLGAFLNPEQSKIIGNLGCAPVPHAEGEDPVSVLWSWNLAISPFSQNKEAAWYFIQWATSKAIQQKIQEQNFVTSRQSAWASENYTANVHSGWLEATLASFEHAEPILYSQAVKSAEINDIVGMAVVNAIQGTSSAKDALDMAAKQALEIIQD